MGIKILKKGIKILIKSKEESKKNSKVKRFKTYYTLIICILVCFNHIAFAQKGERYKAEIFAKYDSLTNVQYGEANNLKDESEKLLLDIYSPNGDALKKRPLVVFLHGGGFKNGDKAKGYPLLFCKGLVKRGFVASSINYRLGVAEPQTDTTTFEAMYRAVQDAKSAIRFFRKNSEKYGIDINQIYIMGGSAGAIAALHLAYLDQTEVPKFIDVEKMGTLEGSSGNGGYSSKVKAVINCWGALADFHWIEKGDIPVFSIHGMKDKTVPFDSSFSSHGFKYGAKIIYDNATQLGISPGIKLFENTGHTLDSDTAKQNKALDEACKWLFPIIQNNKLNIGNVKSVKRPSLTGDAHMALFVSNLEKARAFYGDFLGFQEPYNLKNSDSSLSMTFFKVNENQYIEIFPTLKPGQDRLNHIAFETPNAEQMRLYLASKGVQVPAKVNKVRIGNTSFNIKDPDGYTVEFTQYEPGSWTRREQGKFLGNKPISRRIMHMGILVGDAQESLDFYSNILTLKEFWRGKAKNSAVVSWINMQLPESEDYLEFMLYTDLPAPDKRGAQHHICLEVPDIEKALAQLNASPFRKDYTLPIEIKTGINRKRQINLYDPDGTRIELMENKTIDGIPTPSTNVPLPQRH